MDTRITPDLPVVQTDQVQVSHADDVLDSSLPKASSGTTDPDTARPVEPFSTCVAVTARHCPSATASIAQRCQQPNRHCPLAAASNQSYLPASRRTRLPTLDTAQCKQPSLANTHASTARCPDMPLATQSRSRSIGEGRHSLGQSQQRYSPSRPVRQGRGNATTRAWLALSMASPHGTQLTSLPSRCIQAVRQSCAKRKR